MSTMLFTNNKDKIIFKAKELSYYVLSGLYVKKGITGIPSFAEKFSSLTRFVNADKEDFGVLIQYKIDHFYRDVGGSNHKTVCAFLTEDIKGIGNASKKISYPGEHRIDPHTGQINMNYREYTLPSVSLDFKSLNPIYFSEKEKSIVQHFVDVFVYSAFQSISEAMGEQINQSYSSLNQTPYNEQNKIDKAIGKLYGELSNKALNIFYYKPIVFNRPNYQRYTLIKSLDVGKLDTFFGNKKEAYLTTDEVNLFKDKFRILPREEFDVQILEVIAKASKKPEINGKSSTEIKNMGYTYIDLAYGEPECMVVFSELMTIFYEANNEEMEKQGFSDPFDWELVKSQAFLKKDMNEEYEELLKDIETDPIYDEKKVKKANKIAFEKRIAALPHMKNKVAQIQRDSSLSILVARGYYEEADKILNTYEKMDSKWIEALKS